jgi:hypothetical protein
LVIAEAYVTLVHPPRGAVGAATLYKAIFGGKPE